MMHETSRQQTAFIENARNLSCDDVVHFANAVFTSASSDQKSQLLDSLLSFEDDNKQIEMMYTVAPFNAVNYSNKLLNRFRLELQMGSKTSINALTALLFHILNILEIIHGGLHDKLSFETLFTLLLVISHCVKSLEEMDLSSSAPCQRMLQKSVTVGFRLYSGEVAAISFPSLRSLVETQWTEFLLHKATVRLVSSYPSTTGSAGCGTVAATVVCSPTMRCFMKRLIRAGLDDFLTFRSAAAPTAGGTGGQQQQQGVGTAGMSEDGATGPTTTIATGENGSDLSMSQMSSAATTPTGGGGAAGTSSILRMRSALTTILRGLLFEQKVAFFSGDRPSLSLYFSIMSDPLCTDARLRDLRRGLDDMIASFHLPLDLARHLEAHTRDNNNGDREASVMVGGFTLEGSLQQPMLHTTTRVVSPAMERTCLNSGALSLPCQDRVYLIHLLGIMANILLTLPVTPDTVLETMHFVTTELQHDCYSGCLGTDAVALRIATAALEYIIEGKQNQRLQPQGLAGGLGSREEGRMLLMLNENERLLSVMREWLLKLCWHRGREALSRCAKSAYAALEKCGVHIVATLAKFVAGEGTAPMSPEQQASFEQVRAWVNVHMPQALYLPAGGPLTTIATGDTSSDPPCQYSPQPHRGPCCHSGSNGGEEGGASTVTESEIPRGCRGGSTRSNNNAGAPAVAGGLPEILGDDAVVDWDDGLDNNNDQRMTAAALVALTEGTPVERCCFLHNVVEYPDWGSRTERWLRLLHLLQQQQSTTTPTFMRETEEEISPVMQPQGTPEVGGVVSLSQLKWPEAVAVGLAELAVAACVPVGTGKGTVPPKAANAPPLHTIGRALATVFTSNPLRATCEHLAPGCLLLQEVASLAAPASPPYQP